MPVLKKILLLTILWLSFQNSFSQPFVRLDPPIRYRFVKEAMNQISNARSLSALMQKLNDLKKNDNCKVNIIHIGDSHLQADFITSVIRTSLQKEFGNGGRGLVVPYRIARTNEPFNYHSSSAFLWQAKRCVFPDQPLPIGIGGVTIGTTDSCADFNLKIYNDSLLDYRFNKLTMFYENNPASYHFAFMDSLGSRTEPLTSDSIIGYPYVLSVLQPALTNQITVRMMKTDEQQSQAIIYGLLLENGCPGIVYNTIGVNGAEFHHYSEALHFCDQTKALDPDLIILSLGTNEAYSTGFNKEKFYSDLERLYSQLKLENPDAVFLFTTPACSYRRKKPNPRLPIAAKTIIRFANDNHLAYWDLQGITGGDNSAINWKKNHMLRPDGVHYSRSGYELQANLFCKAFLNAYTAYVANRPE